MIMPETKRELIRLGVGRLRELIGQHVHLCEVAVTQGGERFEAGEILRVVAAWHSASSGVSLVLVDPQRRHRAVVGIKLGEVARHLRRPQIQ